MIFTLGGRKFDFSSRTFIMGVLNVTPDSFSDGGKFLSTEQAVGRAREMIAEGADIVDIGGESTRPQIDSERWEIDPDEELGRVMPVIKRLHSAEPSLVLSIDTTKAVVADEALRAGVSIVNDISALRFDPAMAATVARRDAAVILMHMQGTPATMQRDPHYDDVIGEIKSALARAAGLAREAGIGQIIVDPGIGFGKKLEHNLEILRRLREFRDLGYPVLVGPSRKSFLGKITGAPVGERLAGTAAAVAAAVMNGAQIVRVHDVGFIRHVCQVTDAITHTHSDSWNSSASAS